MVSPGAVPSPDLFEAFFDLSQMGGILFKPVQEAGVVVDLAYVRLNLAAQRMLALPECPTESFLTLYPHATPTGIFAFYRDAFVAGEVRHGEFNYQHDKLDNYFHLAARRVGEHLLVSFTDTSEQPRTAVEQALRESQAREREARVQERAQQQMTTQAAAERQRRQWEELFWRAPAAICIFDGPEWVYTFVNPRYQAMFPGRELLGKRLVDALPEVADQPLMAILHHVYDTGEPFEEREVLVPLARHEGGPVENIYFDLTYLARHDEQGQIDGFITFAYDVTQQVLARRERETRQGEQELARQQVEQLNQELEARVQERTQELTATQAAIERERALLQALLTQAPVAIGLFQGEEIRVTAANELMAAIWGYTPEQVVGRPLVEGVPELKDQGFDDLLRQVLTTQVPVSGTETPAMMLRDGVLKTTYYNFVYQPLYNAKGEVLGVIDVAVDVTEQVEARRQVEHLNQELEARVAERTQELMAANEELNTSNTQLTRTNTDLDTFVYTASHDLKAPITNIEGILNALRETLPAEVQQEAVIAHLLGLLDHTVGRFLTTIFQLTDLTRLQRTYAEPAERLALAPVVAGVVEDLGPSIEAAAAQLDLEVPAGLHVSFAPASLRSIVYNLLSNAVKYCDPARPAQVWLRAEQQPGAVVLTVRDNGLGLTDSQVQRLFGVFQRLHTHVEGTGVGLYMIKRLIENAGATIAVSSEPAVGSTFTVTFPA